MKEITQKEDALINCPKCGNAFPFEAHERKLGSEKFNIIRCGNPSCNIFLGILPPTYMSIFKHINDNINILEENFETINNNLKLLQANIIKSGSNSAKPIALPDTKKFIKDIKDFL